MALDGTVKLPAFGVVKKRTAVLGGLGAAGFVVVAYIYRSRQSAAASSASSSGTTGAAASGAVTDPAGNTCSAVNPATGFCPGTAEDLAAQQTALGAYNTSGLGGGLSGYYYGSGGSAQDQPPGPGNFADNAEWAQYAEAYLESSAGSNPGALSAALGAYINGAPVNASQQSLIEQAIAIAGSPPVSGPNGDPPGINLQHTPPPPPPPPPGKKVKVPPVTGKTRGDAQEALSAAGLKWGYTTRAIPKHTYVVATQSPRAGASVDKGTTVHMSLREKK